MSHLTLEEAKALLYRDTVYHGRATNADGAPQAWRVTGQVKTWKRDPSRVHVPIARGMHEHHYIYEGNLNEWYISEHEAALAHLSDRDRVIVPLKCEFIDALNAAVLWHVNRAQPPGRRGPMTSSNHPATITFLPSYGIDEDIPRNYFLTDFQALISGNLSPEEAPMETHVAKLGALLNKHGESKFVREVMDAFSRGKSITKMVQRRYCED